MTPSIQVTFDCADPDRLARFWADVLGYQVQPPPPGFASWPEFLAARGIPEHEQPVASAIVDPVGAGPRLFFQKVPEGKRAKNRVHLDVNVGGGHAAPLAERRVRVDTAVERLVKAGAARLHAHEDPRLGEYWVVMQDPEGNEFCLQ
ncbi:MAG TPA: VOC family protein [Thermodesulfobacteriota bacterium]